MEFDFCQVIIYNYLMIRTELRKKRILNHTIKYYPWILAVLQRDNNQCIDCGSKEHILVHHLDESRGTGKLNNNPENLITLCRPCHARRHGLVSDLYDLVELRDAGMTFEQIGKRLGFSKQRAHQRYKKYISHTPLTFGVHGGKVMP